MTMRKTDQGELDAMARAFIKKHRALYPGAGWPTLEDARQLVDAALSTRPETDQAERAEPVTMDEWKSPNTTGLDYINSLERAILECSDLSSLSAIRETVVAVRLARYDAPVPAQAVEATPEVKALRADRDYWESYAKTVEQNIAPIIKRLNKAEAKNERLARKLAGLAPNGASS